MSAFTLSSDCYALLSELQLQRTASTRYLQEQLQAQQPIGRALTDKLSQLQLQGLVRLRGEQQWSLTAEGTLALILAVRSGACPMPNWARVPSVTGQEMAQALVRELCLGEAGQVPTYYLAADLLSLLDVPEAHRLLPGSSPQWQQLMLMHFSLQTLLDAEPGEQWPLTSVACACAPELTRVSEGFASEWQWLCGDLAGEVTTHWPALQQLAEQGAEQPLAERLLGALGQWQAQGDQGQWPLMFGGLLWLGWLQQADPVIASEQRKKWQRSLGNQFPLLADLLEIQSANPFRIRAYRNAARTISSTSDSLADLAATGGDLTQLPGIGKDLARQIIEIAQTGKLKSLEERLIVTWLQVCDVRAVAIC